MATSSKSRKFSTGRGRQSSEHRNLFPILRSSEFSSLPAKSGAVAGKISGAGGGGFLMLMTDPEQRYRLITALNENGAYASSVQFTEGGAEAWATSR